MALFRSIAPTCGAAKVGNFGCQPANQSAQQVYHHIKAPPSSARRESR